MCIELTSPNPSGKIDNDVGASDILFVYTLVHKEVFRKIHVPLTIILLQFKKSRWNEMQNVKT